MFFEETQTGTVQREKVNVNSGELQLAKCRAQSVFGIKFAKA